MIQTNELHPAVGLSIGFPFCQFVEAEFEAKYTVLSGDDANSSKPAFQARNLDFTSPLFEAGAVINFFLFGYCPEEGKRWSPYVFGGVNYFHFNPTTEYNGETVELQPLGTEGQGSSAFPERQPYSLHQVALPFGGGVKFALNDTWHVSIEVGMRKTFTDYIDDISTTYVDAETLVSENGQLAYALSNRTGEYLSSEPLAYDETKPRGNPGSQDWYGFSGITISHTLVFNAANHAAKAAHIGCWKH